MRINNIVVKNYRKLYNISLDLDEPITLIVGRNNSGKTSLSELFYKFLGEKTASFSIHDFSFKCYDDYHKALNYYREYNKLVAENEEEDICLNKLEEAKNTIPSITLEVYLEYNVGDDDHIGSFSELNLNLDETRRDISISCEYHIIEKEKFLKRINEELNETYKIEDFLELNYTQFYRAEYFAFDKERKNVERKLIRKDQISNAFILNLISAQRDLDDYSYDKKGRIAKAMSNFLDYSSINEDNIKKLDGKLQDLANKIEKEDFENIYGVILNDLETFGIKSTDSKIIMKALFDAKNILKISNNFLYDMDGRTLPESYNGLGFSNLTIIMLQVIIYCSLFENKNTQSLSHVLFIEEPEAHLHPQMQMVFIRKIKDYINSKGWNVQIVITTHSSQILSDSDFASVRYFEISEKHCITVRSMNEFIYIQNIEAAADKDRLEGINFLQIYMNLGVCNLFFADKIIMVEGTTERMLLPKLIKKDSVLSSQYISIMEVGGAYAHIFENLIKFINIKTLIITDIDSVIKTVKPDKNGVDKTTYPACRVETPGALTSNNVLKKWLPKETNINNLLSCKIDNKIDNLFRVAYQVPEDEKSRCGRSFEEAFFIANAHLLKSYKRGLALKKIFSKQSDAENIKNEAYNITSKESFNKQKTSIAFDILQDDNWIIPRYIEEGLEWLKKD